MRQTPDAHRRHGRGSGQERRSPNRQLRSPKRLRFDHHGKTRRADPRRRKRARHQPSACQLEPRAPSEMDQAACRRRRNPRHRSISPLDQPTLFALRGLWRAISADHGRPRFDAVGKLFACPECGYTANADHNASVNLHRKFFGELATVKKIGKGVYSVTGPDQSTANVEIERIQDQLAPRTVRICRSDPTPF